MTRLIYFGLIVALLLGYVPAAAKQKRFGETQYVFVDEQGNEEPASKGFAPKKGWDKNPQIHDYSDLNSEAKQAAQAWNQKMNRLTIRYEDKPEQDCRKVDRRNGAIVICHDGPHPEWLGWAKVWVAKKSGYIIAAKVVILGGDEVQGTMIHELGHAIGLRHNPDPDSIMYAYLEPDQKVLRSDMAGLKKMGYIGKRKG